MATPQSIASAVAAFAANDREKQLRSVFVGNIPYEATEEQLKDVFAEVGPVVTFRLVFDRETGKPKGYGFCEYKDQETALSAMRNLNAYELNGRTLRVDNAASEKSKEEMRLLQEQENLLNKPSVPPEEAPEAISKAVASLPPEQMFELMKQMQICIQSNPVQAREILLQNSQLAYALLQAQVVMRIVSPETAVSMLQKPNKPVNLISPPENVHVPQPQSHMPPNSQPMNMPGFGQPPPPMNNPQRPPLLNAAPPQNNPIFPSSGSHDYDQRVVMGDRDMRLPPAGRDPRGMANDNKYDPRVRHDQPPMNRGPPQHNQFNPRMGGPSMGGQNSGGYSNMPNDPRVSAMPSMGRGATMPHSGMPQQRNPTPAIPSQLITSQDHEKATLIMQVLQLSQEQIASLPEEQKQSIMVLKEQIARSQQPH